MDDEADWLGCGDPFHMFRFRAASDRKRRLFACACCRRAWRLLPDGWRAAVEASERFADGEATAAELRRMCPAAPEAGSAERPVLVWAVYFATRDGPVVEDSVSLNVAEALAAEATAAEREAADTAHVAEHAALVRCLVTNPFRPTPPAPLRNRAIMSLAQAAYEERQLPSGHLDPPRLKILADALEEAGCTDGDTLAHLRSPGPHVRGCWVLDLVLGRE